MAGGDTIDAARERFANSSSWREAHAGFNARVSTQEGRLIEANRFDADYWVDIAPGSIYEICYSERGKPTRTFRTGSVEALLTQVVVDGLVRSGKRLLISCEFDERPSGFVVRALGTSPGCLVEWGTDGWAEFLGPVALSRALVFCRFSRADPGEVTASIRSSDGSPLMQQRSRTERCGPEPDRFGEVTVESWESWLQEKEGLGHDR